MQQKELRLGVVLTGGVSLVVYMHGVSKELLKLVRASRSFQARGATGGKAPDAYSDTCPGREVDTENVYFDLLKTIGGRLDMRIVIDVIAGASAGGVNGIVLARALAHDMDIDRHRKMWLKHADAIELLDESSGRWRKKPLQIALGWVLRNQLKDMAPELETQEKVSQFVSGRWFQPPFSGPRYSAWLLNAIDRMSRRAPAKGSLMPDGHPLDLCVSVTDFHGHTNRIALHMPPEITERDHRHVMQFSYIRQPDGDVSSDFGNRQVPGLVYAARATSSFPGAFPPLRISELDGVLRKARRAWETREDFVARKLGILTRDGRNIDDVFAIDGSVVNDKPFGAAIAAIAERPAYRAVTRRILFIEPAPVELSNPEIPERPGFFRTILSSLAEIPRNEPINDDLARVNELNAHIRLLRRVVDQAQPLVDQFVDEILPSGREEFKPTSGEIAAWRNRANEQAAATAGYAFHSYFQLKVLRVGERMSALVEKLVEAGLPPGLPASITPDIALELTERGDAEPRPAEGDPASQAEIDFLKTFDVEFRVRRLRYLIRRLNALYADPRVGTGAESHADRLDDLKATLYGLLEDAKRRWDPAFYSADDIALVREVAQSAGAGRKGFAAALSGLGRCMKLVQLDQTIDEVFAVMVLNYIPETLRRDFFSAYLGFSFFDVMSFPMTQWGGFNELEEILIDRISPADAVAIRAGGVSAALRGTAMRKFAGFFNRSYRENDYLWGRLNAADRLVDILLGAVEETDRSHGIDAMAFKKRLFAAILDAEEQHLTTNENLIPDLRREIAALDP